MCATFSSWLQRFCPHFVWKWACEKTFLPSCAVPYSAGTSRVGLVEKHPHLSYSLILTFSQIRTWRKLFVFVFFHAGRLASLFKGSRKRQHKRTSPRKRSASWRRSSRSCRRTWSWRGRPEPRQRNTAGIWEKSWRPSRQSWRTLLIPLLRSRSWGAEIHLAAAPLEGYIAV